MVGRVGVLGEVGVEVGLEVAAPEVLLEGLVVGDGEGIDEDGALLLEGLRGPAR